MGEHAGGLGWVCTGAYGSWDGFVLELSGAGSPASSAQQTLCLLCNPLHEPLAPGCVVQPPTPLPGRGEQSEVSLLEEFGASGTAWDGLPLSSEVREPFSMDGLTGVKRLRAGCAEGRSQAEVPFPHRCGWQGDREVADLGVSISQLLPPSSPSTAVWRKGQALPALCSFPGLTASIGDLLSPSSSQVCLPILRTPFLPTLPAPRAQAGQPHALGT